MNKNQIVIHAAGKQTRIALIENGELAQFFIESPENRRSVGDIYLAEVHKVMGGIRAAFINMGTPKDAFLHFSDLGEHLDDYLVMLNGRESLKKDAVNALNEYRKKSTNGNGENDGTKRSTAQEQNLIGTLLQPKQKVLVQIVKEPIGNKGPRVSTDITLPGRLLVLIPMGNYVAVSKRIRSFKERRRLRSTVSSMLPDGFGVIVRTVADGQSEAALREDLRDLLDKWKEVIDKLKDAKPTALLHRDLDMTESLVRDLFSKNYDRILIDDPLMGKQLKHYVSRVAPEMVKNIELYKGREHIFEHMKIARDVDSIFSPRVKMPSGGYLIFEQTEAMYVVDVNSGRYAAKKAQEDNSLRTNLEAAREIAKQLRLRDIGGIIVVDFIDLQDDGNRKKVYDELKKEFRKDRAKTNLLPMSDFGLVQITRQRIRPSVVKSVSLVCPMCGGSGSIVSQNTVLSDIETWLSKYANSYKKRSVELNVNPYFHSLLTRGLFSQRLKWMFKYRLNITILGDETVSLNEFKMYLTGTEVEITQTVQEGKSIDEAILEAERRLAELESEGQRDDSLLDYGSDEGATESKGTGRGSQRDRQTDRASDRDRSDKRQGSRQQQDNRGGGRQQAPAESRDSAGQDREDDRRTQQRPDSRRSNVKSKYYKSRADEGETGDSGTDSSGSAGPRETARSRAAVTEDEQAPDTVRTDSNGEPLRNAEDVAREYREKRMREEALQKEEKEKSEMADKAASGENADTVHPASSGGEAGQASAETGTAADSTSKAAGENKTSEKPKPKRGGSRKTDALSGQEPDSVTITESGPGQEPVSESEPTEGKGKTAAARSTTKKAAPKRTTAKKTAKPKAASEAAEETGKAE